MPKEIEREFEREYGKKKGDLIFYKWETKHGIKRKHKKDDEHIKKHMLRY